MLGRGHTEMAITDSVLAQGACVQSRRLAVNGGRAAERPANKGRQLGADASLRPLGRRRRRGRQLQHAQHCGGRVGEMTWWAVTCCAEASLRRHAELAHHSKLPSLEDKSPGSHRRASKPAGPAGPLLQPGRTRRAGPLGRAPTRAVTHHVGGQAVAGRQLIRRRRPHLAIAEEAAERGGGEVGLRGVAWRGGVGWGEVGVGAGALGGVHVGRQERPAQAVPIDAAAGRRAGAPAAWPTPRWAPRSSPTPWPRRGT